MSPCFTFLKKCVDIVENYGYNTICVHYKHGLFLCAFTEFDYFRFATKENFYQEVKKNAYI